MKFTTLTLVIAALYAAIAGLAYLLLPLVHDLASVTYTAFLLIVAHGLAYKLVGVVYDKLYGETK